MARRATVAILDDEVDLTSALAEYLDEIGYEVKVARSVAQGQALLHRSPVDLVVLDLNMPGGGGLDLLLSIRADEDQRLPVLILTANSESMERIVGLELGADDFVVKPIEPRELAARIAGLLRRFGRGQREIVPLERTTVDLTASRLLRGTGPPERLGPGEIVLIRAFARNPNRVLTRDELLDMAPAEERDPHGRAIDTRVTRLRRKLDTAAIVTVHGRGYMFVPPAIDLGSGG